MENIKKTLEKHAKKEDLENIDQKEISRNAAPALNSIREILPIARNIKKTSEEYLSHEAPFIGKEKDTELRRKVFLELAAWKDAYFSEEENEEKIIYDKYKKSFFWKDNKISIGEILSSRKLGSEISLDKNISNFGEGKRLLKALKEKKIADIVAKNYGEELSKTLSEKIKREDYLKSKAYEEIYKRSKENKEQFGIKAEQIFISLLESISIDRTDLSLKVYEANPWQDVENKIDFILERKNKKKGIGVEEKEDLKTIGVQFTTATSKKSHKLDQIRKAKYKIKETEIDDIIYIEIDSKILRKAIDDSKKEQNKFLNPIKFLPKDIKDRLLKKLFKDILNDTEIKSLEKNI